MGGWVDGSMGGWGDGGMGGWVVALIGLLRHTCVPTSAMAHQLRALSQ